jgi:hypothetical protein
MHTACLCAIPNHSIKDPTLPTALLLATEVLCIDSSRLNRLSSSIRDITMYLVSILPQLGESMYRDQYSANRVYDACIAEMMGVG